MSGSRTRYANHFGTPWSVRVCGNQSPHIILSTSFQYDTSLAYIRQISSSVIPSCSSMICSYAPCGIRVTSVTTFGSLVVCRAVPHNNSNNTVAHSNIFTFTAYFVLGHIICQWYARLLNRKSPQSWHITIQCGHTTYNIHRVFWGIRQLLPFLWQVVALFR